MVLPSSQEDNEVIAMQAGRELWRQSSLPGVHRRSWQVSACLFWRLIVRSMHADGQTGEAVNFTATFK
jgi:hypothetical protein